MPVHIVLSPHLLFPALMQTNVEGNENSLAAFCSKFSTRHAKVSGGFPLTLASLRHSQSQRFLPHLLQLTIHQPTNTARCMVWPINRFCLSKQKTTWCPVAEIKWFYYTARLTTYVIVVIILTTIFINEKSCVLSTRCIRVFGMTQNKERLSPQTPLTNEYLWFRRSGFSRRCALYII
jgi:hypothetical protein